MSSLEHHYRRMLRWYPADHRRRYEDEMLGVLLAAAEPDQERPGLRDRADLLLGAIEIRLGRVLSGLTGGWGDALALVSVIAPLLLLSQHVKDVTGLGMTDFVDMSGIAFVVPGTSVSVSVWATSLGLALVTVVIAAAALRGARITAATLAWISLVLLLWIAGSTAWSHEYLLSFGVFATAVLPLVTALALTIGNGPVRGLELIGLRRLLLVGAVSMVAFILDQVTTESSSMTLSTMQLAPPVVFAVLGGLAMGQPATRRAAAILAVPIYANLWVYTFGIAVALSYLLPAIAFLVVAAWTIRRSTSTSETPVAA